MNSLKIVAIALIVGVLGLAYGGFSYTKETHEAKASIVLARMRLDINPDNQELGISGYLELIGVLIELDAFN